MGEGGGLPPFPKISKNWKTGGAIFLSSRPSWSGLLLEAADPGLLLKNPELLLKNPELLKNPKLLLKKTKKAML